jgi:hypothetical protein
MYKKCPQSVNDTVMTINAVQLADAEHYTHAILENIPQGVDAGFDGLAIIFSETTGLYKSIVYLGIELPKLTQCRVSLISVRLLP